MLIPEELDVRLRKAAQRSRTSKGEWVRRAIEDVLQRTGESRATADALARLGSLDGPTGEIDQLLAEIEAGRK